MIFLNRTKAKYAEVVKGIVDEQYKILWDYGEELKRTNPGHAVQVEVNLVFLKKVYVCLRAYKDGFKAGYRLVIGLDRCFLKSANRVQLLAMVGIDGYSFVFLVARVVVVDAENRSSWSWIMQFLMFDI